MAPQPICACLAVGAAVTVAAISVVLLRTKWKDMASKLRELERSLALSIENCNSERQGRIRAQQTLRKEMLQLKSDKNVEAASFPMTPIGTVQSCFSTRNGTPRQPLLVPLARACLVFDPARVPMACLEGLEGYSHCWVIFVFHLNTNLDKLWKDPSQSKMKAKVKVPRLIGGKMGVLATRSPHRPIPIGLTVAKIEAVNGHMVLLSGIDLVDGTPVLDIKPYLPYCDSIQNASVPDWIMEEDLLAVPSVGFTKGFSSSLANCWESLENNTLYASADEIRDLIKQILSWDIRSSSQRTRPHKSSLVSLDCEDTDSALDTEKHKANGALDPGTEHHISSDVVYHLTVENLNISYKIDAERNVVVEGVSVDPAGTKSKQRQCNYMMWDSKLRQLLLVSNKSVFGNFHETKFSLLECIEKIQVEPQHLPTDVLICDKKNAHEELSEVFKNEEIMWRKKSWEMWLREGDRNTSFFIFLPLLGGRVTLYKGAKGRRGNWILDPNHLE